MTARKPHVSRSTEDVIAFVRQAGITSVSDVAEALDVSVTSARRHLDGGVARGELIRDEYDDDGQRLHHEHWRYAESAVAQ